MVTPNFLLRISIALAIYFLLCSHKPHKNTSLLVVTVLKKSEFLGPSPHAQNVCAVAKGGPVLWQDFHDLLLSLLFNSVYAIYVRFYANYFTYPALPPNANIEFLYIEITPRAICDTTFPSYHCARSAEQRAKKC